jgi:hypothetical protein
VTNWDAVFKSAEATWPFPNVCISNLEPSGEERIRGKTNPYGDNEKAILAAAKKHGYQKVFHGRNVVFTKAFATDQHG